MQVLEARTALDGQALGGAGQRIARQMRILAGQKLDDVDAQTLRALVEERERQVLLPRLLCGVLGTERPVASAISCMVMSRSSRRARIRPATSSMFGSMLA